jgi:uncharacterized membrane protein
MSDPHPVPQQTSTGLAPNLAGALSYLLGPVTGIVFLLLEKENRFVRFHAAQSVVVGVAMVVVSIGLTILSTILAVVPVIGWVIGLLLSLVLGLGCFALWLLLMFQAYMGKEWELPVVGPQARKLIAAPAVLP